MGQAQRLKALEAENARLRRALAALTVDQLSLQAVAEGKILSPARRRIAVSHVRSNLGDSERRVCRALGMSRSSLRYTPQPRDAEAALTHSMVGVSGGQYGRYRYRRVHALLQAQGWQVSPGRVMRWWCVKG